MKAREFHKVGEARAATGEFTLRLPKAPNHTRCARSLYNVHLNISMPEGRRQSLRAFGATLAVWLLILSLLTPSLNPVLHARSSQVAQESSPSVKPDPKKAKEAYQEGVRAEKAQDWETAYTAYSDAVNWAPNDRGYFLRREIAKSGLVQIKVDAAEKDAISGRLDAARRELLSASYLDPTNTVVRERLRE